MLPYILDLGFLKIPSYGAAMAAAYVASYYWIIKNADSHYFSKDFLENAVFYSLLFGLLGGKAFYIVTFWHSFGEDFSSRFYQAFSWENIKAGFVFYGGLISACVFLFFYCRRKKISFLKTADLFAPAAALAHAIGRIGCFAAGCCHGGPTESFLGVVFSHPYCQTNPHYMGIPIHPTQLYESAGNFIIFAVLSKLYKKKYFEEEGIILGLYVCSYSVLRFFNEFFRADSRGGFFLGFSQAQVISLILFTAALIFIFKRRKDVR